MVFPSRQTSRVKAIHTFEGEVRAGPWPPLAVTLTLEDEIDVSRGDMLVHPNNVPLIATHFEAMLVWMAEEPMQPGKQYFLKQTTTMTPGVMTDVRYRINVNTLHREDATQLALNEIGRCAFALEKPIACDPYRKNRTSGAFVVIDRLTNNTVGAGMIIDRNQSFGSIGSVESLESRPNGPNDSMDREQALQQHALTVWLTGLSGSGKSSVAERLEQRLHIEGFHVYRLDGDSLRLGLNRDLAFSAADRAENIRRIAEVARLFNQAGLIVLVPVIAPFQTDRQHAAEIISADRFFEVYVDTPLEVCEERDVKGLYQKARAGEITDFTGISSPYEPPPTPALRLLTVGHTVEESADAVFRAIAARIRL